MTTWDAPKTEQGLQQVLRRLSECRAAGDRAEIGNGLLALAFLVKWVRSDTDLPPFERAHELALEALEHFRAAADVKGQVRALEMAAPFADPQTREGMLQEAEALAESTGDEDDLARVLAARARSTALKDKDQARKLNHQVAEIYRRTGNKPGLARCLFGLAIGPGSDAEKRSYALEGAAIHRELGNDEDACRLMMVALLNLDDLESPVEREKLAMMGLHDALKAEDRSLQGHFCGKLAEFLVAQGRHEEAKTYQNRQQELEEANELTPRQKWEEDVAGTEMLVALAEKEGCEESVEMFRTELKRLMNDEPAQN